MKILFVEPPKDFWFVMGDYMPPPFGILTLAAYLESKNKKWKIEIVDCQAEKLGWKDLEKKIEAAQADVVAPSGLATSNAYMAIRTAELAKKVNPATKTVVGGQHFTALADESLKSYAEIDFVVRGEGEQTFYELVKALDEGKRLSGIRGLSFKYDEKIFHTQERPQIENLDSLPLPAYHLVKEHMKKYYFSLMSEKDAPFAIVEGSRGCSHDCSYCSQWRFWSRHHRQKSPERIADEFEFLHAEYGSKFFWLTDDNFRVDQRANKICEEIISRGISEDVTWFCQARCEDIVGNKEIVPKMHKAGNVWMLVGFDSPNTGTLENFRRHGINKARAKETVELLRQNDIFSQGTFIIGERSDSHESIEALLEYANLIDPDIATFMALTPFPGTDIYDTAKRNGWIEDTNWRNYDMIHAIMPTQHLTREEVQKELHRCYRDYFGDWGRRYRGIFSKNPFTRRTYQYLARKAIITGLRSLF